jgi:hypothetical protein
MARVGEIQVDGDLVLTEFRPDDESRLLEIANMPGGLNTQA